LLALAADAGAFAARGGEPVLAQQQEWVGHLRRAGLVVGFSSSTCASGPSYVFVSTRTTVRGGVHGYAVVVQRLS
jgi:hypothetical protein